MRSCAVRVAMKQFDLVNKLRERITNLEAANARAAAEIFKLKNQVDEWKTRTSFANRMVGNEREIRIDAERRLAELEARMCETEGL